jgi:hypothetical protein
MCLQSRPLCPNCHRMVRVPWAPMDRAGGPHPSSKRPDVFDLQTEHLAPAETVILVEPVRSGNSASAHVSELHQASRFGIAEPNAFDLAAIPAGHNPSPRRFICRISTDVAAVAMTGEPHGRSYSSTASSKFDAEYDKLYLLVCASH